ncbi:MAG TPA: hypothetical protein VN698_03470 [Bacteroidia bacterium]|nr:hypothetical protein [Bacteroidia bacterium]
MKKIFLGKCYTGKPIKQHALHQEIYNTQGRDYLLVYDKKDCTPIYVYYDIIYTETSKSWCDAEKYSGRAFPLCNVESIKEAKLLCDKHAHRNNAENRRLSNNEYDAKMKTINKHNQKLRDNFMHKFMQIY